MANTYQARTATLVATLHARAANSRALSAELRFLGINPNDPVVRSSFENPESAGPMTELEYRAGVFIAIATWQQWDNLHSLTLSGPSRKATRAAVYVSV